jgi:hypothetical protein
LTFTTTADASIDEAAPTVANGATAPTDCRVNDDSGARQECRLRFVVSGIQVGDTVTSAKVLIRNKGGAGSKHVNMSTVASTPTWAENAITWANKPPKVALQGSDSSHAWNVDSEFAVNGGVVGGNGTYNFALHSPPASYTQGLNFHTKENTVGQPAPRLVVTIDRPGPAFGINVPAGAAAREAYLGRVPWARGPYYDDARNRPLPTMFSEPDMLALAGSARRLQMSFKILPAKILDGSVDARLKSYLDSVPAGWTVGVTYWHEPNCELSQGADCVGSWFSASDFKAAWYRVGGLIKNSTSAGRLIAMPNYTGPGNASFRDEWVVARSQMPPDSILTWDRYGNPNGNWPLNKPEQPLAPYHGLYQPPREVFDPTLEATTRLGWGDSWGITEFNAPRRDNDQTETYRRQWFTDTIAYLTNNAITATAPKHLFVWEGQGSYDQRFLMPAMWDTLRPYFMSSP